MKFTRRERGHMRTLKAKGTMVGPVTQQLIDLAVEKYEWACDRCESETEEFGWFDFLGPAREQLSRKENAHEKVV